MDIFLSTLFIVICILLVIVVLLQKGRGGGLGAAFGGAGSSAFGTRTGDVFTWVTIVLTALFLLLAVVTSLVFRPPSVAVKPPTFNPQAAEISGPVPVRIVPAESPKTTKTYYTLDGTLPDEKSKQYMNEVITVQPGTTITARTFARNQWSAPNVGKYPLKGAAATSPTSNVSPEAPASGPSIPTTEPAAPGLKPASRPTSAATMPTTEPAIAG